MSNPRYPEEFKIEVLWLNDSGHPDRALWSVTQSKGVHLKDTAGSASAKRLRP